MCEQERERERVRVCEYAEEGDIETANVCERVEWRKRGESGDTLTFPLMRKRSVLSLTPPNECSIKTPPKVKTAFFWMSSKTAKMYSKLVSLYCNKNFFAWQS